MNNKILTAISAIAIALAASTPLSFAKVYTPSQFTAELKKQIGTKKGLKAANAANSFFKSALSDKKNSKNADKYAKSVVSALKKPVAAKDQGNVTNTLVGSLTNTYFKNVKPFNLNNVVYKKALVVLLKGLPATEKSKPTVSQAIYVTIKNSASKNGVTRDAVYTYYNGVAAQSGVYNPPPAS